MGSTPLPTVLIVDDDRVNRTILAELLRDEVLRRLRAERQTANTAVIFITAMTDEEDEERGLALGVLDYVFKPIRPVIVHARIRNVLRLLAQTKGVGTLG